MDIELQIDGGSGTGILYDNPVADQIAGLLPLDLRFRHFNGVETLATLASPLRMAGVPQADAPDPGEIGYYAPGNTLVLYYGSPGRWPGLVRVGRFDFDLEALRDTADGTRIVISALAAAG